MSLLIYKKIYNLIDVLFLKNDNIFFLGQRSVQRYVVSNVICRSLEFLIFWCLRSFLAIYDLITFTYHDLEPNNISDLGQANQLGNFLGWLCRWNGPIGSCMSCGCGQNQASNSNRFDLIMIACFDNAPISWKYSKNYAIFVKSHWLAFFKS